MADQNSAIVDELMNRLDRLSINARDLSASLEYAEKSAEDLTDEFKSGTRDVGRLKSSLESSARTVKDAEKKYAKAQEEYNNTTDASRKEELRQSLAATRQRREELVALHTVLDREITARIDTIESQKALADSTIAVAKALKTTIGGVLSGLQGNASAVGIAGGALTGAFSAAGSAGVAAGSAISAAGSAMTASSNKYARGVGIFLDGLGAATSLLSKGLSETAQAVLPYLTKEVERTLTSFQSMSASGAMFADGMDGMRKAAADSGLSLETFSKIVSSNSAAFAATGMSVAGATARFSKINNIIGTSGLQQQMLNLGYGLEEIGSLTAETMADLNRGGSLRYASDSQVAKLTADYSKDLRLLTAITGEDARKKTEEGRKLASQLAVRSKLQELEKQQPGITQKFNTMVSQLGPDMAQSVIEIMQTGRIINSSGAIMAAQSQAFGEAAYGIANTLTSGNASAEQFAEVVGRSGDTLRGEIAAGKFKGLDTAALLSPALSGLNQSFATFITELDRYSTEGVRAATEATTAQATTRNEFTNQVTQTITNIESMKVKMEEIARESGALDLFSKMLVEVTNTMRDALKKLGGEVKEGLWDKTKRIGGAALGGAATGAAIGGSVGAGFGTVTVPVVGTVAGGLAGAVGGGLVGGIGAGVIEAFSGPGKALGGISAGPDSGYMEKLHGVEAVVPLPDGRTIPVSMDSGGLGDLAGLMREQIKLVQEMLSTLRDSQDIQDRLLANSY